MPINPKRKALPKPTVFKYQGRWVCEYYRFDNTGRPKPHRKSFVRELKRGGQNTSVSKQRQAALTFRDQILKELKEEERIERREKEQTYLTLKELKEAKAAFAIFNQIPHRKKSLVDAVIQYRDNLKLAVDTPPLRSCVEIFLGRKQEAAEASDGNHRLSYETYRTLKQRLNHMLSYFEQKYDVGIKLGDATSKRLIAYIESLDVSERTRRNYINTLTNFFNDASDPRDKHRFLHENPMDGVYIHFKKLNRSGALKNNRKERATPKVLQIEQVNHVLRTAYAMRDQGMLGFTVAGLFLGMRPSEVFDLSQQEDFWRRYIKLEEGIVRIDGFGKKRDQRTILISDNCKAWLEHIHGNNIPFCFPRKKNGQNLQYANFRAKAFLSSPEEANRLIQLRKLHKTGKKPNAEEKTFMETCKATLQEYEDVLRHTFGTNFYYHSGFDKNRTIEQMGHSGEVFIEHYRGLLDSPKNADLYFTLHPDDFSKED